MFSASDYCENFGKLLAEEEGRSLIYAALELRCGVEARMREYLGAIEHIPKAQRQQWEIAKLGRSLANAYQTGDKMMVWGIEFREDGATMQLLYTPVVARLQRLAEQAALYLHAPRKTISDDHLARLREILKEAHPLLIFANSGELIGLPLMNKRTGQVNVQVEISESDPRYALVRRVRAGTEYNLSVKYTEPDLSTMRVHSKR